MSIERLLADLSDDELLRSLVGILSQSRRSESDLVAHIGEVDARRLFAREASPSMFVYCTEVLHLSEAEAYLRIAAARAARAHPVLLAMLADGRVHLSGIAKLVPHLTLENRDALLLRATHKSKRQIEELVAELAPRPDVAAVIRKLPQQPPRLPLGPDGVAGAPLPGPASIDASRASTGRTSELRPDGVGSGSPLGSTPSVEPLAPARYRVQFTASGGLRDKLERLRTLMRTEVPDGDLAAIIEQAVTEKLERLEARRHAKTTRPRKTLASSDFSAPSRHVPAAVQRVVRERDGNQCCFVDSRGRRCPERHRLEYHHRRPYGYGGDLSPQNICLMCRAHNLYMAKHDYGTDKMSQYSKLLRGSRRGAAAVSPRTNHPMGNA